MSFSGTGCERCNFTGIENVGLHSTGTKPCDHCGGLSQFKKQAPETSESDLSERLDRCATSLSVSRDESALHHAALLRDTAAELRRLREERDEAKKRHSDGVVAVQEHYAAELRRLRDVERAAMALANLDPVTWDPGNTDAEERCNAALAALRETLGPEAGPEKPSVVASELLNDDVQAGGIGLTLSDAVRNYARMVEREKLEEMAILAAETIDRHRSDLRRLRADLDEARRRITRCTGPWLKGSGGHRVYGECHEPADFIDREDGTPFCETHLPEQDKKHAEYIGGIADERDHLRAKLADWSAWTTAIEPLLVEAKQALAEAGDLGDFHPACKSALLRIAYAVLAGHVDDEPTAGSSSGRCG